VATLIANRLSLLEGRRSAVLILVIMLTAGLLSSVLSSLLVTTLLLPAVLRLARRERLAPALFLLPLVVGSTMGNVLTLIGTISNLVVSDLVAASGYEPLGFFSLTPYGLASLAGAVVWFVAAGSRLLRREAPPEPQAPSLGEVEKTYGLEKWLHRLRVRSESPLIARRLDESPLSTTFRLNVLAVRSAGGQLEPARPDWILDHNDLLVVEGGHGDALQAAGRLQLEHKGTMPLDEFNLLEQETLRLAELMIPFRSQLVGQTLANTRFRERYNLNILAVHRRGRALRQDLPELTLAVGDTLLVQGPIKYLRQAGRDLDLIPVTHLGPKPGDLITSKARLTLGILAAMMVCVVTGWLSLATASLAAAVALILTGCVSLERAYQNIEGSVIILIGGMLPLAMALEKTGVAQVLAGQIANLGPAIGPLGTLLLLYLCASGLTQVVSNSAAGALMTPIALNLAVALGASPQTFALAMALAVTTSYLTPLTNTENLLIRQPGHYTMRDYLVNGLPVFLIQTAALMLLFWLL
jgi:di/tricarboxylate transporter